MNKLMNDLNLASKIFLYNAIVYAIIVITVGLCL